MTDRASFLAAIRATPRGEDPGLPDRIQAPDAPTELRAGESPVERLVAETELVSAEPHRVARASVGEYVAELLRASGSTEVALTEDLAAQLVPIRTACEAVGVHADDYRVVATDRARASRLHATVTGCAAAVAATGSIVTTAAGAGRAGALIAPLHICVVEETQIVDGLHALFDGEALAGAGSLLALQSGPSRSADIEKVLILGVHGPGVVHLVIVGD
jgi:L-lactate utilization protein LutC